MKQTAVEFIVNELLYLDNEIDMKLIDKNEYYSKRKKIIEQAKAMENEQQSYSEKDLREAFRQGENNVGYNSKYGYTFKSTEKEWFKQFKKK